uniref:Uncharacterized protein n=1 Tax=Rhipicephalus pulchellus TaxID=72859 RepID=L7MBA4_RHIPC
MTSAPPRATAGISEVSVIGVVPGVATGAGTPRLGSMIPAQPGLSGSTSTVISGMTPMPSGATGGITEGAATGLRSGVGTGAATTGITLIIPGQPGLTGRTTTAGSGMTFLPSGAIAGTSGAAIPGVVPGVGPGVGTGTASSGISSITPGQPRLNGRTNIAGSSMTSVPSRATAGSSGAGIIVVRPGEVTGTETIGLGSMIPAQPELTGRASTVIPGLNSVPSGVTGGNTEATASGVRPGVGTGAMTSGSIIPGQPGFTGRIATEGSHMNSVPSGTTGRTSGDALNRVGPGVTTGAESAGLGSVITVQPGLPGGATTVISGMTSVPSGATPGIPEAAAPGIRPGVGPGAATSGSLIAGQPGFPARTATAGSGVVSVPSRATAGNSGAAIFGVRPGEGTGTETIGLGSIIPARPELAGRASTVISGITSVPSGVTGGITEAVAPGVRPGIGANAATSGSIIPGQPGFSGRTATAVSRITSVPSGATAGTSAAAISGVEPGVGMGAGTTGLRSMNPGQPGPAEGISIGRPGIISVPSAATAAETAARHGVGTGATASGINSMVPGQPGLSERISTAGSSLTFVPSSPTGGISEAAATGVGPAIGMGAGTAGINLMIHGQPELARRNSEAGHGITSVPSRTTAATSGATLNAVEAGAGTGVGSTDVRPLTPTVSRGAGGTNMEWTGTTPSSTAARISGTTTTGAGTASVSLTSPGGPGGPAFRYTEGSGVSSAPTSAAGGIGAGTVTGIASPVWTTNVSSVIPAVPVLPGDNNINDSVIHFAPSSANPAMNGAPSTNAGASTMSPSSPAHRGGTGGSYTEGSTSTSTPSSGTAGMAAATMPGVGSHVGTIDVSLLTSAQPGSAADTHTGGSAMTAVPPSTTAEISGVATTGGGVTTVSAPSLAQPVGPGARHTEAPGMPFASSSATAGAGPAAVTGGGTGLATHSVNSMLPAQPIVSRGTNTAGSVMVSVPSSLSGTNAFTSTNLAQPGSTGSYTEVSGMAPTLPNGTAGFTETTVSGAGSRLGTTSVSLPTPAQPTIAGSTDSGASVTISVLPNTTTAISVGATTGAASTAASSPIVVLLGGAGGSHAGGSGAASVPSSARADISGSGVTPSGAATGTGVTVTIPEEVHSSNTVISGASGPAAHNGVVVPSVMGGSSNGAFSVAGSTPSTSPQYPPAAVSSMPGLTAASRASGNHVTHNTSSAISETSIPTTV